MRPRYLLSGLYRSCLFVCSVLLLMPSSSYAIDTEDLMDMDFSALMKFKVVSASVLTRPLEKMPVVVDIIDAQQIRDLNRENIYELLSFVPGLEVMETYFGRTVLNFRGILNTHYNNKFLMMINGNPIFEPVNGSAFLDALPISAIQQIEIIRGRGGVLYGTNAYSGVVNFVTKKQADLDGTGAVKAGYGSFDTKEASFHSGYTFDEDHYLFVAGNVKNNSGYPFNVEADEKGNSNTFDYETDTGSLYANYDFAGLSVQSGYFKQDKSAYGITPVLAYKGQLERNMWYAHARYEQEVVEDLKASIATRYTRYENPEHNIGMFPAPGFADHEPSTVNLNFGGNVFNTQLGLRWEASEFLSVDTAVIYERAESDQYQFLWVSDGTVHPLSAYSVEPGTDTRSFYTQVFVTPIESIDLVAGIRGVDNSDIEDPFFVNNFGIVYGMEDTYYLKLMYGEAFRAPDFFEKHVATGNVLFGSTDLEQESTQSVDLSLEGHFKTLRARLNSFVMYTADGISRVPTTTPETHGNNAAIYVNLSETTLYGVEFLVASIRDKGPFDYGVNLSWKEGEDDASKEKLRYFANYLANAWVGYRVCENLRLSPSLQYIGARDGITANGNYSIDAYYLLNLSAEVALMDKVSLFITGSNLFNKDYEYPEFVRSKSETIPGGAERAVYASVEFAF